MHEFAWAPMVTIVLDVLAIATVVAHFRRDRVAGTMLRPSLGWLLDATALNAALLRLN